LAISSRILAAVDWPDFGRATIFSRQDMTGIFNQRAEFMIIVIRIVAIDRQLSANLRDFRFGRMQPICKATGRARGT
jgi:hypothetical protein